MLNTSIRVATRQIFVFLVVFFGFIATDVGLAGAATARRTAVSFTMLSTSEQVASFSGQLTTTVSRRVVLQRKKGRWMRVARVRSAPDGSFSIQDSISRTATYRLVAPRWRTPDGLRLGRLVSAKQAFTVPTATITPPEALTDAMVRAESWLTARVPYSQSRTFTNQYGTYRTDCSGFVSMVWALASSYTTRTLPKVAVRIAKEDLAPGDIMNAPGYHAAVFAGWVDEEMTSYWAYEQSGSKNGMVYREVPYPYWNNKSSFVPLRKAG